jgi:hypothetical protein
MACEKASPALASTGFSEPVEFVAPGETVRRRALIIMGENVPGDLGAASRKGDMLAGPESNAFHYNWDGGRGEKVF